MNFRILCHRCHNQAKLTTDEPPRWFCAKCGCWVETSAPESAPDTQPSAQPTEKPSETLYTDYRLPGIKLSQAPGGPAAWFNANKARLIREILQRDKAEFDKIFGGLDKPRGLTKGEEE